MLKSSNFVVVVNTSPVIYLSSLGILNVIRKLFGEVLIPQAVKNELTHGSSKKPGFKEVSDERWIKTRKINSISSKKHLLTDLDEGEAEVIILAEEAKASLIIMDDRLGRKFAKLKGYNVIGTLRLLVIAKNRGLISEVNCYLEKLKENGFWLDEDVCRVILKQAGEIKN